MYLKDCLIENVGPISFLDLSLPFNVDGTPKPLILVGKNGSGKSILLSYIADALIEFAKCAYTDAVKGQQSLGYSPFFKFTGPSNQKINAKFGIGLLEFFDKDEKFSYVDKSGDLFPDTYNSKLRDRFNDVRSWEPNGNYKKCSQSDEKFNDIFKYNSICYFPSSRNELPHWLNTVSLSDSITFEVNRNLSGILDKPIFVESSMDKNKKWILDVFLDSLAEVWLDGPQLLVANVTNKLLLKQSKENLERILQKIFQDDCITLAINLRNTYLSRLCISKDNKILIPSLDNLSSGQSILFSLFTTIIRYADKGDINKSRTLNEIEGIVLIDEVDAHLDSDLQYVILPNLIKLFPKIQFILTTHSPLFLLGMEKCFEASGFQIIEMPEGQVISVDRFSEFHRSFDYYKQTKEYEDDIRRRLIAKEKPVILTEGETDSIYINTYLRLSDRNDLLSQVDIDWVGGLKEKGKSFNTGDSGLNNTKSVFEANPGLLKHKLLLLYDFDTNKPKENNGLLSIRSLPKNEENTKIKKGIENLFPKSLFEKKFYLSKPKEGPYGEPNQGWEFQKMDFCKHICEVKKDIADFKNFSIIIEIIDEFLKDD